MLKRTIVIAFYLAVPFIICLPFGLCIDFMILVKHFGDAEHKQGGWTISLAIVGLAVGISLQVWGHWNKRKGTFPEEHQES